MKEDLIEDIAEGKVYTTRIIVISTFFGSVLAGGFMIYQNFKTFGEHKKAGATILLTIAITLALMGTAFVPALDKIPGFFFTILITLIISLLTKRYQSRLIEKHINNEGKIYSSGRAVLICIISILLIAAFILGVFFLQDAAINES